MRINLHYLVILICGIMMSSCQKEEIITEHNESIEALIKPTNPAIETFQNTVSEKAAECTKINLFANSITVTEDEFFAIESALLNSGISLVAPGCNVYYYQNSNIFPGWTQKVNEALIIENIGANDVTFSIDNLKFACYGCFANSFCTYHNSTIHVALGNNSCLLGSFTLDVFNHQDVVIDLTPMIDIKKCQLLDCVGSGS